MVFEVPSRAVTMLWLRLTKSEKHPVALVQTGSVGAGVGAGVGSKVGAGVGGGVGAVVGVGISGPQSQTQM